VTLKLPTLLTRKFGKFLKNNSRDKTYSSNRYNSKKITDFNFAKYTCFSCGNRGHIKVKCPNTMRKEKGAKRKYEKKGKAQKSDDSSSSSSSKNDEEANLCLMENEDLDTSSVNSNTFIVNCLMPLKRLIKKLTN